MLRDEDWRLLRTVWERRVRHVLNVQPSRHAQAEQAVANLYGRLGRPAPTVHWYDFSRVIELEQTDGMPLQQVMPGLLYGLWFKVLPESERVATVMGYDPATGLFRISSNKRLLFNLRLRRSGGRFVLRPAWMRTLDNMICQFDAPGVAWYEFLSERGDAIDPNLVLVAEGVRNLLDTVFGAFLFERSCVLVDRPKHIALNAAHLLSATNGPAFTSICDDHVYAVNGTLLGYDEPPVLSWANLASTGSPRERIARIEYIGWDNFFNMAPGHTKLVLDTDRRFGTLYRVQCGLQLITLVRVRNTTPEPDGSHRMYVIPVDHQLRPLPNPLDPSDSLGEPQDPTALNAVASTFGLTGERYRAVVGAES